MISYSLHACSHGIFLCASQNLWSVFRFPDFRGFRRNRKVCPTPGIGGVMGLRYEATKRSEGPTIETISPDASVAVYWANCQPALLTPRSIYCLNPLSYLYFEEPTRVLCHPSLSSPPQAIPRDVIRPQNKIQISSKHLGVTLAPFRKWT